MVFKGMRHTYKTHTETRKTDSGVQINLIKK